MTMLSEKRRSEILHHNIGTSDCGVVALQAVTRCGYDRAEEVLTKFGYEQGVGTPRGGMEKALDEMGVQWEDVPVDTAVDSPATFSVTHEYGNFILYVEGHVMALVDGGLMNGRGSWGKALQAVRRIVK